MDTFFQQHFIEIILAFIFAIIAAIFCEKTCKLFTKLIRRIIYKLKGEWKVFSLYPNIVPNAIIEDAIRKHDSLRGTHSKGFHYRNISNEYHLWREVKSLFKLLQDESFFLSLFRYASRKVSPNDIDLILCTNKYANTFFAGLLGRYFSQKTTVQTISYNEKKVGENITRSVEYESGETLDGKNIVLVEALHIFPEPLIEIINAIKTLGGNLKKIVILFNGFNQRPSFTCWGVKNNNILVLNDINLQLTSAYDCRCNYGSGDKIYDLIYDKY